ncbi:MAG: single-stranded DNA-binding protein [bacterium]|nr:single-stranded DNA-binding protein [bacterium]
MANKRSLNRVILVGTVGRDPEITHIPSLNKDVAKFSMVTTDVFMDKNTNEFKETPEWHNVVAWDWIAKKVEKSFHKGALVLVEGRIKTRKWKDKNDQDRWTTEIGAETVVLLERSHRDSNYSGGQQGGGYGGNAPESGGYNAPRQGGSGGGQQQARGGDPYSHQAPPAPPEVQINDMQYDESDDPF